MSYVQRRVTVTYTVQIKADGTRGDDTLANFVFRTGGVPAAGCVPGDPLYTHPITTPPTPTTPAPAAPLAMTGANVIGAALLAGGALLLYRRKATN